ncbi:hypothetical protein RKD37_001094 [Streptomyces ambofaciens]
MLASRLRKPWGTAIELSGGEWQKVGLARTHWRRSTSHADGFPIVDETTPASTPKPSTASAASPPRTEPSSWPPTACWRPPRRPHLRPQQRTHRRTRHPRRTRRHPRPIRRHVRRPSRPVRRDHNHPPPYRTMHDPLDRRPTVITAPSLRTSTKPPLCATSWRTTGPSPDTSAPPRSTTPAHRPLPLLRPRGPSRVRTPTTSSAPVMPPDDQVISSIYAPWLQAGMLEVEPAFSPATTYRRGWSSARFVPRFAQIRKRWPHPTQHA